MEKVIAVLMRADSEEDWCARQRGAVADALLELGLPGLAVNVRDDAVRRSLMTLTTLDPPVAAVVSMWTQQCYGEQVAAALRLLAAECEQLAAYLVTESVPLPAPQTEPASRTPGLANIALLRRPAGMDQETWLTRWQRDHTPVAIETQSTFGYTQNWVVRTLTQAHRRSPASSRNCSPPRRSPICRRSSGRPTNRTCSTGWAEWWPAPRLWRQREHRHGADQPLRRQDTVRAMRYRR